MNCAHTRYHDSHPFHKFPTLLLQSTLPLRKNYNKTGEVILFAAKAVEIMKNDGLFVLLEGREQTVNYVRTPHRFTLTLSDSSLIGKRRAAQRLMADALGKLDQAANTSPSPEDVSKVLEACLAEMVKEEE